MTMGYDSLTHPEPADHHPTANKGLPRGRFVPGVSDAIAPAPIANPENNPENNGTSIESPSELSPTQFNADPIEANTGGDRHPPDIHGFDVNEVFEDHWAVMRSLLPSDMVLRLPEDLLLVTDVGMEVEPPMILVNSVGENSGLSVDVRVCGLSSECRMGNFAVARRSHPATANSLAYHQERGYPITLTPEVQGHLLTKLPDGTEHDNMSVMWEQEDAVYRVQFPALDRQNILNMARSMALNRPITTEGFETVADRKPEDLFPEHLSPRDLLLDQEPVFTPPDTPTPRPLSDSLVTSCLSNIPEEEWVTGIIVESVQPRSVEFQPASADAPNTNELSNVDNQYCLVPTEEPLFFSSAKFESIIDQVLNQATPEAGSRTVRREVTREHIQAIGEKITNLYFDNGYITSRAEPRYLWIEDDTLWLGVVEGAVNQITIDPIVRTPVNPENSNDGGVADVDPDLDSDDTAATDQPSQAEAADTEDRENPTCEVDQEFERENGGDRLRTRISYICDRIQLGADTPLRINDLEEHLRMLRDNPLFDRMEADLIHTNRQGQSDLIVRLREASPWHFGFSADNYATPSVGAERFGVWAGHRNLTGRGDELEAKYYRTDSGGLDAAAFTYRLPLNAMNGTLQLQAAFDQTQVTQRAFDELDIRGDSESYRVSFRQPLHRKHNEEFALSWGFRHRDGSTTLFDDALARLSSGPDSRGVSRTSVFSFGQEYWHRDSRGAWGLASTFNFGTGLFNATTNDEPIPDSHFFSWQGQAQRVQRLNSHHLLVMRGDIQLTPDSLLPSERFFLGGGQSVRGYRQNARSGDGGVRLSIEDRIKLDLNLFGGEESGGNRSNLYLIPFLDVGAIWAAGQNPNDVQTPTVLAGSGLGLLWDRFLGQDNLSLRVDYAIPLVPLDADEIGKSSQEEGIFFQLLYNSD